MGERPGSAAGRSGVDRQSAVRERTAAHHVGAHGDATGSGHHEGEPHVTAGVPCAGRIGNAGGRCTNVRSRGGHARGIDREGDGRAGLVIGCRRKPGINGADGERPGRIVAVLPDSGIERGTCGLAGEGDLAHVAGSTVVVTRQLGEGSEGSAGGRGVDGKAVIGERAAADHIGADRQTAGSGHDEGEPHVATRIAGASGVRNAGGRCADVRSARGHTTGVHGNARCCAWAIVRCSCVVRVHCADVERPRAASAGLLPHSHVQGRPCRLTGECDRRHVVSPTLVVVACDLSEAGWCGAGAHGVNGHARVRQRSGSGGEGQ